jgi:mannose-6-phosphate isomerase-like protein (cupin superfamily)
MKGFPIPEPRVNDSLKKGDVTKPLRIIKGWGHETIIVNSSEYCGKILHMNPKSQLSMHFHMKKEEHFYILTGSCELQLIYKDGEKESLDLRPEDVIRIPPGLMHSMKTKDFLCNIMEISTTHHDNDSFRVWHGD